MHSTVHVLALLEVGVVKELVVRVELGCGYVGNIECVTLRRGVRLGEGFEGLDVLDSIDLGLLLAYCCVFLELLVVVLVYRYLLSLRLA